MQKAFSSSAKLLDFASHPKCPSSRSSAGNQLRCAYDAHAGHTRAPHLLLLSNRNPRSLERKVSSSQPVNFRFSETHTPSCSAEPSSQASIPVSSCPADTILPGVNYLKGQAPVVALPDDQYPEWLWNVLKPRVYEDDGPGGKKERMERRKANQRAIKDRNFMQTQ
jgi:large subunit ribosomal protein L54